MLGSNHQSASWKLLRIVQISFITYKERDPESTRFSLVALNLAGPTALPVPAHWDSTRNQTARGTVFALQHHRSDLTTSRPLIFDNGLLGFLLVDLVLLHGHSRWGISCRKPNSVANQPKKVPGED